MIDKLLNQVSAYLNEQDKELIKNAYEFAKEAHLGQKRESGEEYLIHPVALAYILADLQFDAVCISASLLHDVIEDTKYTYDDIKEQFGKEIADIVDGLTKISKLEFRTKQEEQAENVRKMLIAMAKDIRVIFIKLADRLHNMRTIKYLPENKRKQKAQETLDIYAPLAHRLGIFKIKWELEDISFRYLNEEAYYDIVNKVTQNRAQREAHINQFIQLLKLKLSDSNIDYKIEGRAKHFYSIYRKLERVANFDQIYDLLAVRILVTDIQSCYAILGIVHTAFAPIPGKFKDYIAMPKPNMYQSLHTTVMGAAGPIEVQIRTYEMHRVAEYGIAAHWKYKESGKGKNEKNTFDEKLAWLRQVMEWNNEVDDSGVFYELIKGDLFTDEVYVFTPQGDVINLPAGSCPLDFAYRIHSDVGNKCVGAKINNKIVPVSYKLKNGDIVEILTSANSKGPSRDWLNIVQSSNTKNKIRNWFKKVEREKNIQRGKEILEREIKRLGFTLEKFSNQKYWDYATSKFNYPNITEMYLAVGFGGIKAGQILRKIMTDFVEDFPVKEIDIVKKSKSSNYNAMEKAIKIGGHANMAVRMAKCCNPVPGDEAIGFITRGRGVTVHRVDCANIFNISDDERLISVEWQLDADATFSARILVEGIDNSGVLGDLARVFSDEKINVHALNAKSGDDNIAYFDINVDVKSKKELSDLIAKIKKLKNVLKITRL